MHGYALHRYATDPLAFASPDQPDPYARAAASGAGSPEAWAVSRGVDPPPLLTHAPLCPFRQFPALIGVGECMAMHGYAMHEYALVYPWVIHYAGLCMAGMHGWGAGMPCRGRGWATRLPGPGGPGGPAGSVCEVAVRAVVRVTAEPEGLGLDLVDHGAPRVSTSLPHYAQWVSSVRTWASTRMRRSSALDWRGLKARGWTMRTPDVREPGSAAGLGMLLGGWLAGC